MINLNMGATIGGSGNTRINVESMIAVQTGTYQDQYVRPFKPTVNDNVINALREVTRNGLNLGAAAVQEVACDVITPQANVEGLVSIANGMQCRRFRILLTACESHPYIEGTTTRRTFYGYSDNCDASLNYLDPNMRVYFNSETIIAEAIRNTINGPQRQASIVASNQIISPMGPDNQGVGNGLFARASSFLIRPEDNFNLMQTNTVAQNLNASGMFPGMVDTSYDHRSMVGEGGAFKYSMRRDTSPTRYLSDSLAAYSHAVKESKDSIINTGDFNNDIPSKEVIYGEAAAACRNHNIHSNTFLSVLNDHTGYMEQGYVTFGDLCRLFPEMNNKSGRDVVQFAMDDGRSIRKVTQAQDSQAWSGADYTSIGASLLAQAIPSIMMDTFFRSFSFAVTNGAGPNNYIFEPHPDACKAIVSGVDMRQYFMDFERRLRIDVLNNITRGNQLPFKISMYSDLVGDSIIDISIGGGPVERFIAPTFADSLFSPVITRNRDLAGNIANDLTWLVTNVIEGDQSQSQKIYTGPGNGSNSQAVNMFSEYQHPVAQPAFLNNSQQGNSNVANLGLL